MKYGGFFLKGLAGSLQGMPQRIYEVRWKAKQEKKLKDKEEELKEILSLYTKTADELYADDWYSKEDISKLNTIILSGGSEFLTIVKDTHSHITGLYEAQVKQDFELIDSAIEMLKTIDLKNIDEAFESIERFVKSEDALNRLSAYKSLLERQIEAKPPKPEVFPTAEAVRERYPEAGVRYTDEGYVPTFGEITEPKAPGITDYSDAWNYLYKYKDVPPETFNKVKPGFQKQFSHIDMTDITQEALRSGVKPEPTPTPTAFKTLQSIKEEFKNVKTKAEYDSALASYNASKEAKTSDWAPPPFEDQLIDLIKKVESAFWADFVNKDGKLKDKTEAELYNKRVQQYLALIEEAKNAGIDVSQFQAFIPYKELYWGRGNPLVTSESW